LWAGGASLANNKTPQEMLLGWPSAGAGKQR
jgi:hypothetical protein